MDYMALTLFARLMRISTSWWKKSISAGMGSIYVILSLAFPVRNVFIENVITYIVILGIMLYIVVGNVGVVRLLKYMAIFYVIIFVMSGIANWLYYNTVLGYILHNGDMSLLLFPLCIGIAWIVGISVGNIYRKRNYMQHIYPIKLWWGDSWIHTYGLIDTGNNLRDPFFNKGVSIVEKSLLFDNVEEKRLMECKYHLIPFRSLGNDNGLIGVIEMGKMTIFMENTEVEFEKVWVGLYEGKLANDGKYKVLLNSAILEEQGEI